MLCGEVINQLWLPYGKRSLYSGQESARAWLAKKEIEIIFSFSFHLCSNSLLLSAEK